MKGVLKIKKVIPYVLFIGVLTMIIGIYLLLSASVGPEKPASILLMIYPKLPARLMVYGVVLIIVSQVMRLFVSSESNIKEKTEPLYTNRKRLDSFVEKIKRYSGLLVFVGLAFVIGIPLLLPYPLDSIWFDCTYFLILFVIPFMLAMKYDKQ